jgi:hypothetical protein
LLSAFATSFAMATVISSNMLLSSFIYALAMRKKLLREISPIAFKKYRHVPDFSVILFKWLNCYNLNEKYEEAANTILPYCLYYCVKHFRMAHRASNLLSSILLLNQFSAVFRIYLFTCKLFLVIFAFLHAKFYR